MLTYSNCIIFNIFSLLSGYILSPFIFPINKNIHENAELLACFLIFPVIVYYSSIHVYLSYSNWFNRWFYVSEYSESFLRLYITRQLFSFITI